MHGGASPGAPKGNRNAFKHGLFSAEVLSWRRQLRDLSRRAKDLVELA